MYVSSALVVFAMLNDAVNSSISRFTTQKAKHPVIAETIRMPFVRNFDILYAAK